MTTLPLARPVDGTTWTDGVGDVVDAPAVAVPVATRAAASSIIAAVVTRSLLTTLPSAVAPHGRFRQLDQVEVQDRSARQSQRSGRFRTSGDQARRGSKSAGSAQYSCTACANLAAW